MSVTSFWAAFGSLITVIVVQIVVFANRYGQLQQQVQNLQKKIDAGFTCPMHNKIQEDVIRMEERANMAKEISLAVTAAVASAKVDWEKLYKEKVNATNGG